MATRRPPLRFNKAALKKVIGDVNAEYLFRAGGAVRQAARRSLKPGKYQGRRKVRSTPGSVPYVWSRSPLKNLLFFALDPYNNSMVVGSAIFPSKSKKPAPGLLEHGGHTTIQVADYVPANRRKWGDKHYSGSRPSLSNGKGQYRYFRTVGAYERARESEAFQRWGRNQKTTKRNESVYIAARPYMSKALEQVCSPRYSAYLYKQAVQAVNRPKNK